MENVRSNYILKPIFENIPKIKLLKIIIYNKNLQKKAEIQINDYKNYYEKIEIEIIPKYLDYNYNIYSFINISNENRQYYHIYINDDKNEINNKIFFEDENITKIKIIIDSEIKSFEKLFYRRSFIKKITFIEFFRNDINSMKDMFSSCESLIEINFNNFKTNNVTDMSWMFYNCKSLKKLNLNNFNTQNVINMRGMFYNCISLEELNITNFDINNVKYMGSMFYNCTLLKELNLENFNFNTLEIKNISYMFTGCGLLKKLDINNFNINKLFDNENMLCGCADYLEIKSQNKIITKEKLFQKNNLIPNALLQPKYYPNLNRIIIIFFSIFILVIGLKFIKILKNK